MIEPHDAADEHDAAEDLEVRDSDTLPDAKQEPTSGRQGEPTPQDIATAYHEAGHAAMSLMLRRPIERVSIEPNQVRLGQCKLRKSVHGPLKDAVETEILILLGGLASLPVDPYEAAKIDGANAWQSFRHITLPLLAPFLVVALIIRTIDALKAFDTIYVITQGGPGTASETINIFLYLQAFAYYNLGYASAVVVVFFAIIILLAMVLLWTRARVKDA